MVEELVSEMLDVCLALGYRVDLPLVDVESDDPVLVFQQCLGKGLCHNQVKKVYLQ